MFKDMHYQIYTGRKFLQNNGKNLAAQLPENFRKIKEIPFLVNESPSSNKTFL
jgi:hypothetical protein